MYWKDKDGTINQITAGGGSGTLTVAEQDGTPSVTGVTTIRVTDGTLTDEGSGIVSIDTGGGSGSCDCDSNVDGGRADELYNNIGLSPLDGGTSGSF